MGDCNTLKTFPNPHHCDPHLDQTKYNDLLLLTIDGVLKFIAIIAIVTVALTMSSAICHPVQIDYLDY